MSPSKSNQSSLSYLQSISTHNQPVKLKGATISFFQSKASPLLEISLLAISYVQLLAQALLVNPYFAPFPNNDSTSNFLLDNLSFISKIFAPGSYNADQTTLNVLFITLLLHLCIKVSLTGYIAIVVRKDWTPNRVLLAIWRVYCKVHDRLLCFIVTSLWVSLTMNAQRENSTPFGIDPTGVTVLSVLFMSHDILHAMIMNVRYNVLLPTKDILQSKTNTERMCILWQRSVLQILFIFMNPNDLVNAWIIASLNLAFSIFNGYHCYTTYPFYSLKTLKWYSGLLSMTTALNLSFFLRLILDAANEGNNNDKVTFAEVIIYWFIFSVLLIKGGHGYLKKIIVDLMTKKKNVRSEMLIHRILIIKQIRKLQKPSTSHSSNYEWAYLMYTAFKSNITAVFDIDLSKIGDLDFDKKEDSNRLITLYLENLMEKYPKECLIKLYAAYYYGKKLKEYTPAMKLLLALQKSPSKQIVWNSLHLLEKMQLAVQAEYKNDDASSEINLAKYIYNLITINKLKERILKQAKLQLDILKENNKTKPDIGKIYDHSQKVIVSRNKIQKITQQVKKQFPDYYLEPQLLLAYYHSVLNFSALDYQKHHKTYRNNYERYQKKLEEDSLSKNNLYEKETALIVITSEIRKTSTISYCSKAVQQIFDRDLKDAQAFTIMPAMLQNFYFEMFRDPEENKDFLGKVHRTFILHREDYLVEVDFYFNIHPFISQGLNYNLLIRPVQEKKEHIIISTTGLIEGFTPGIAKKLLLHDAKKAHANINQISKELGRSSEACNSIMNTLVKQKSSQSGSHVSIENSSLHSTKELERAQNLWNIINTEGRDLMLRPYKQSGVVGSKSTFWNEPIVYHCTMHVQHYGSKIMKVITLEELLNDYDSEHEIKTQRKTIGNTTLLSKATFKEEPITVEPEYSLKSSTAAEITGTERFPDTKRKDTSRSTNLLILPSTERNENSLENITRRTNKSPDRRENKSRTLSLGTRIISPQGHQTTILEEDENETQEKEAPKEVKIIPIQSLLLRKNSKDSYKSKSSTQEKVSRAIKEAFNIRFYPKYILGFQIAFYLLFVAVFVTQIILNINVQHTTDRFNGIKNILKEIVEKESLLTSTYIDMIYMIDLQSGRLSIDDFGFFTMDVDGYIDELTVEMKQLADVNNRIIQATKLLSNEDRKELFEPNVEFYETGFFEPVQTFTELNGFLATQRIVETSLRGLNLAKTDFNAAMVYFNQVLRNSLDDVLLETNNGINSFLEALTSEKESFEKGIKVGLAIALVLLAIKILGSAIFVWCQYKTEALILLAFIKLKKSKINQISANINSFRQAILNENSLEDFQFDDSIKINQYLNKSEKKVKSSGSSHKYETITPNSKGIIHRYLFHYFKLLILLFIILAYIIAAFVVPQNNIKKLYNQVNQAFFSDNIALNTNIALAASHLTLNVNSTEILIIDVPAPYILENEILNMQDLISQTLAGVSSTEWNYGPAVGEIFYGNGCGYVASDFWANIVCEIFSTGAQRVNIISLLGLFKSALEDRFTRYQNSDKSYESLRNITKETFEEITTPYTVLSVLAEYISNMVDNIYDESTDSANRTSLLNLYLMCVILIVTGTLSWWAVLRPVQETDNKMKNVLQMLPSSLILSNFILKNYLIRTSNGALNFVRNNI